MRSTSPKRRANVLSTPSLASCSRPKAKATRVKADQPKTGQSNASPRTSNAEPRSSLPLHPGTLWPIQFLRLHLLEHASSPVLQPVQNQPGLHPNLGSTTRQAPKAILGPQAGQRSMWGSRTVESDPDSTKLSPKQAPKAKQGPQAGQRSTSESNTVESNPDSTKPPQEQIPEAKPGPQAGPQSRSES